MEDWADWILSTLEVNLDKFLERRAARGASGCTSARRRRSSRAWCRLPATATSPPPTRRRGHPPRRLSKRDERRYGDRPIPDDLVQRILDAAASLRPANRQARRFVVVESEEARARIADAVYVPTNASSTQDSSWPLLGRERVRREAVRRRT